MGNGSLVSCIEQWSSEEYRRLDKQPRAVISFRELPLRPSTHLFENCGWVPYSLSSLSQNGLNVY
ncbi:hypothetical protein I7I53_08801 [Histoplasma capsulatum var. duboisii H88]|uniref:Uncharacterized protein n=1 Tax=Ajellomyces capsulatus (strain H88) TaxID=544711 RepID=A0A8A1L517_AJEC8|nr:hypothetical protein I7I53_08801 [Histoplasma capsulatum var. duboisii H88]